MLESNYKCGSVDGSTFFSLINTAYTEVLHCLEKTYTVERRLSELIGDWPVRKIKLYV